MNALMVFYPGDGLAFVAGVVTIDITLISLIGLVLLKVCGPHRSAARHAICKCALCMTLLTPVLAMAVHHAGAGYLRAVQYAAGGKSPTAAPVADVGPRPAQPAAAALPAVASVPAPQTPALLASIAVRAAPLPESRTRTTPDWPRLAMTALFGAWVAGAAYRLLRLLHGLILQAAIGRRGRAWETQHCRELLEQVRAGLGGANLPRFVLSGNVDRPVVAGLLRPRVFLPEDLPARLRPDQLRQVLIHECAHLRQKDQWVGLLQRVADMLFWPHPLVRILNRELARAREEVCDNYVLRLGDAAGYAEALLGMTRALPHLRSLPAAIGLFDSSWRLDLRVEGLFSERRSYMTAMDRRALIGTAGTFLFAGLLVAFCQPGAAGKETGSVSVPRVDNAGQFAQAVPGVTPPAPRPTTAGGAVVGSEPLAKPGTPGAAAGIESLDGIAATNGQAVVKALRWLKVQQREDGAWDGRNREAMTGLALLTFARHGETAASVEFGSNVVRAINYLVAVQSNQAPNLKGAFSTDAYAHGIATLGMAETALRSKDAVLHEAVENAIQVVVDGQQEGGGFNYGYAKVDRWDTSVSGWQIQALKAAQAAGARNAGLQAAIQKSAGFLKSQAFTTDGAGFAYSGVYGRQQAKPSWTMTGAGTYCLQLIGDGQAGQVAAGLNTLTDISLKWPAGSSDKAKVYGWYYATHAKANAGGETWQTWRAQFPKELAASQKEDGHWENADFESAPPTYVYSTTFTTLILETDLAAQRL